MCELDERGTKKGRKERGCFDSTFRNKKGFPTVGPKKDICPKYVPGVRHMSLDMSYVGHTQTLHSENDLLNLN